jgi:hypothetical protein
MVGTASLDLFYSCMHNRSWTGSCVGFNIHMRRRCADCACKKCSSSATLVKSNKIQLVFPGFIGGSSTPLSYPTVQQLTAFGHVIILKYTLAPIKTDGYIAMSIPHCGFSESRFGSTQTIYLSSPWLYPMLDKTFAAFLLG